MGTEATPGATGETITGMDFSQEDLDKAIQADTERQGNDNVVDPEEEAKKAAQPTEEASIVQQTNEANQTEPVQPETATRDEDGDEPTQTEPDAASTLDPLLRHAGERAGLNEEDIDTLLAAGRDKAEQTLQKLKDGQDKISRELGQLGRQALQQQTDQAGNVQPQPGQQSQVAQQAAMGQQHQALPQTQQRQATAQQRGTARDDRLGPLELDGLDDDIYDELNQRVLNPLVQHVNRLTEEVTRRSQTLQRLEQDQRQRHVRQLVSEADKFIEGLPDAYRAVYGDGSTLNMNVNSEAYQARRKLLEEANAIALGARMQGRQMDTRQACMAALSVLSPELGKEAAAAAVAQEATQRAQQQIGPPSSRVQAPADSEGEAVDAAAEKGADIGLW
ncbi:MAG: hypothetical protein ACOC7S_00815 [Planctomycetota bacterium]